RLRGNEQSVKHWENVFVEDEILGQL
ncbi:hypothetical protein L195_g012337, partial [Trifolium pratense]